MTRMRCNGDRMISGHGSSHWCQLKLLVRQVLSLTRQVRQGLKPLSQS
ncbi:hypothetical protein QUA44_06905 [Microcoleus sp. N9_A2]